MVQKKDKESVMIKAESDKIPYQNIAPAGKSRDVLLRFFSRKHAERYRFSSLSEIERTIISHTIVAANGRIAFIKNPKAGCTTVANLLYRYDHGHDYDGDIHQTPIGLRAGIEQWPTVVNALRSGVSFSIVRNPLNRSISAYFDFFVNRRNKEAAKHLDRIETFGFSRKNDLSYRYDVFLEYVNASLANSALNTDRHFRPQHINLGHGEFELSHIGHVETLDADLKKVSELANVDLPRADSLPDARQNRGESGEFVPSVDQRRKIHALYARDYELYGY